MLNKFQELVKEHRTNYYDVTINGETRVMRLFYHDDSDTICYYKKGSRKYGYPLRDYTNITLHQQKKTDEIKQARRFLKKFIAILTESGLWKNMLDNAIAINNLSDEDLLRYLKGDEWEVAKELGIKRFGTDTLSCTIKKGFKKINYHKYDTWVEEQFAKCIKEKKEFRMAWRKGYDNSVDCRLGEDGIMRAWYSEEFKGCGNGHYYLAVNSTHAIFCEND